MISQICHLLPTMERQVEQGLNSVGCFVNMGLLSFNCYICGKTSPLNKKSNFSVQTEGIGLMTNLVSETRWN